MCDKQLARIGIFLLKEAVLDILLEGIVVEVIVFPKALFNYAISLKN